jgi:hypothetical protein
MHKLTCLIFILAFGISPMPADAHFDPGMTARGLAVQCHHGMPSPEYLYCVGFIEGVVTTMDRLRHGAKDCIPDHAFKASGTGKGDEEDNLATIFSLYMSRHPEKEQAPPDETVMLAMADYFHCRVE